MAIIDNDDLKNGTEIHITVQSLHGITVRGSPQSSSATKQPVVTATVTFTGSNPHMEVGSSTLCARTGQLLVESKPLHVETMSTSATAHWYEQEPFQQQQPRPHLMVHMPHRDPTLPTAPLTKSNRGSEIVKSVPSLDDTTLDTSSTACSSHFSDDDDNDSRRYKRARISPTRSGSAFWSNSGAALPEFVELTVRLKSSGADDWVDQEEEGVVYLVLFGHDSDRGTYTMDLPVRRIGTDQAPHEKAATGYSLPDGARLRVQIKAFFPNEPERAAKPVVPSCPSNESGVVPEVPVAESLLEEQIAPIMEKARQAEMRLGADYADMDHDRVLTPTSRRRRAIANDDGVECDENREEVPRGRSSSCVAWNFDRIFRALANAVQCNSGSDAAVLGSGSSVGSTIATRESMILDEMRL